MSRVTNSPGRMLITLLKERREEAITNYLAFAETRPPPNEDQVSFSFHSTGGR